MNATEARKLTRESSSTFAKQILPHIYDKIKKAANAGKSELTHPLMGYSPTPNNHIESEVWKMLEADGFVVTHHPDPDPGDPRGGAYTSISW